MRKLILILVLFLITGCASNEDFKKECFFENKSNNLSDRISMVIYYDSDDVVKNVSITRNFKTDDVSTLGNIKKSSLEYINRYGKENITVSVSKDSSSEYELKYNFDARKVDEDVLEEFNLRKNSIRMFQRFKRVNIECEG